MGIDAARDRLDVAVLGEKQERQVSNARQKLTGLVQRMQMLCPELIVVEATGGYQRGVAPMNFDRAGNEYNHLLSHGRLNKVDLTACSSAWFARQTTDGSRVRKFLTVLNVLLSWLD